MSEFYANEAVSLEKRISTVINPKTATELLNQVYELDRCATWIKTNNFRKVCLQFPDHLLPDSSDVALRLQQILGQTVYILADTAYESCCIDYVAAAHVEADAIIHFGAVCFSKTSANIPYLNIFEKDLLDVRLLKQCFNATFSNGSEKVTILLDTAFIYLQDKIATEFSLNMVITVVGDNLYLENDTIVFIGGRNMHRKLPNLKYAYKPHKLYYYNEEGPSLINYEQDEKILRRRYFLIEKIKDSQTFGIVIGTLAVKNYLQAIQRIKQLIAMHKKKYYMISVGKPTVAKLANFPEIDIYIVVTCALNEIYDSRDYYKPIVTMYDIEMALNPASESSVFTYDYNEFISRPIGEVREHSGDVSLLSGSVRAMCNVTGGDELVVKEAGTVALNTTYGAGFLAGRTWTGLERQLDKPDVTMAGEGRRGIPQQYDSETN